MAIVTGFVERIIYSNDSNGYKVIEVSSDGEDYVLVGNLMQVEEGEYISAEGSMKVHPSYGEQLSVEKYEIKKPEDRDSLERYLSSGAIKGIGKTLAKRIIKKFGDDTLRILEEEPERLSEIKGISMGMAQDFAAQILDKKQMRDAMIYLQGLGITMNLASKIYKKYGDGIYTILKENPYKMADDLPGVGFKIADDIAIKTGITVNSEYRIKSGIYYILMQAAAQGHMYLPEDVLLDKTMSLLGTTLDDVRDYLVELQIEKKIVVKNIEGVDAVYPASLYFTELSCAAMLRDLNIKETSDEYISELLESDIQMDDSLGFLLGDDDSINAMRSNSGAYHVSTNDFAENGVEEVDAEETDAEETDAKDIELDDLQKKAVIEAMTSGLLIITGGPGTGKTTTINAIIAAFEKRGFSIELAAPTGRAAKRMKETTGYDAKTIHRLLEATGNIPDDDEPTAEQRSMRFMRNEEFPIEADVVIIDEVSMVDIFLMSSLLKAISIGTRLILVGDVNQLPSVGPGNVLRDIIDSGCFNVVRLTRIYRQAARSDIVVNAHRIINSQDIDLTKISTDFLFYRSHTAEGIQAAISKLLRQMLPQRVGADIYDIQVLTPMRKGALGVDALNVLLQSDLNPPSKDKSEKKLGSMTFREGDKVMQIKNNYQRVWCIEDEWGDTIAEGAGVFNGDIGVIIDIDSYSEYITVLFDENKKVHYEFAETDELEMAYAITIHKSQGNEYPAVIIPMWSGPHILLTRNLIYTAITRAKSCVVLVGDPKYFYEMVANTTEMKRYCGLKARIINLYENTSNSN